MGVVAAAAALVGVLIIGVPEFHKDVFITDVPTLKYGSAPPPHAIFIKYIPKDMYRSSNTGIAICVSWKHHYLFRQINSYKYFLLMSGPYVINFIGSKLCRLDVLCKSSGWNNLDLQTAFYNPAYRISYVYYSEAYRRFLFVDRITNISDDEPGSVRSIKLIPGERDRIHSSTVLVPANPAEFYSKPSDKYSGYGRDKPVVVVKGFRDLDENEWKEVIGGAFFCFEVIALIAYSLAIRDNADEERRRYDEKRNRH